MLRSIRNVKLLKCVSLICLSPLFVFYSSLNYDGPRTKAFTIPECLLLILFVWYNHVLEKEEFKCLFDKIITITIIIIIIIIIIPSRKTLWHSERFNLLSHFTNSWNLIVWVNPDSTLVDSSGRFDNLRGSHLQSKSELLKLLMYHPTLTIK